METFFPFSSRNLNFFSKVWESFFFTGLRVFIFCFCFVLIFTGGFSYISYTQLVFLWSNLFSFHFTYLNILSPKSNLVMFFNPFHHSYVTLPPTYITSSFSNLFTSWPAGDQLVVPRGVTHISCHYKNTIEGTGENKTNKQTRTMLGVNSRAEGELCNTLCMCRLTLAWVTSELPQSNWNADSS